jgi:thioredoxin
VDTTDDSFAEDVLAAVVPVLVDFWAPWCRPCRAVDRILDELAERHAGRLLVARVNLDENAETGARYGVLSLPTVIVFSDGRQREVIVGARPRSDYERAAAAVLEPRW